MTDRLQVGFLALLEAHQKIVLKVASIYCWDPEERRDLIQEIDRWSRLEADALRRADVKPSACRQLTQGIRPVSGSP